MVYNPTRLWENQHNQQCCELSRNNFYSCLNQSLREASNYSWHLSGLCNALPSLLPPWCTGFCWCQPVPRSKVNPWITHSTGSCPEGIPLLCTAKCLGRGGVPACSQLTFFLISFCNMTPWFTRQTINEPSFLCSYFRAHDPSATD